MTKGGLKNMSKKDEQKNISDEQKNKNFVQLYRNHIDDIARLAGENYSAYKLFMLLIKHMDGTNALAASNTALSEILGMSTRTIQRAVKYLKDGGWISVLKSGTSNVYAVNHDIVWTSYGNQKSYSKFKANVLLSSSENAEYLNNPNATTHYKTIDTEFIKSVQEKREQFENDCKELKAI